MSTTAMPYEDVMSALATDGYYCIQDPSVGSRIQEMERVGSQFSSTSKAGLEFYKSNVLSDERVRTILESSFEWCGLGFYDRIKEDPGHIFQLTQGGKSHILLVQLWSKGSEVKYYPKTHLTPWKSFRASNRFWEIPRAVLQKVLGDKASQGTTIDIEHGGLTILDSRLAFEMSRGSPITCGFAEKDELRRWRPLASPGSVDLTKIIAELETAKIGVHFVDQSQMSGSVTE